MNHPDHDAALQRALLRTAPDHAWHPARGTHAAPRRSVLQHLLAHLALSAACLAAVAAIVWMAGP